MACAAFISLLKFDSLQKKKIKTQVLKNAACCALIQYKRPCHGGLYNVAELFIVNHF